MKKLLLFLFVSLLFGSFSFGQNATLKGKIIDKNDKLPLIGAVIRLSGTYYATGTDEDGNYVIENIKPGDYTIKVNYIGYTEKIYTGITLKANETKNLNIALIDQAVTTEEVTVVGERNLIDVDDASSKINISGKEIEEMNMQDVQEVVAVQAGVSQNADGIQIRGARVYETTYLIDGISASDPLAGTGFGVELTAGSIGEIELITGGAGAEFGDGTAGVISTTIREGGEKFQFSGSWTRDNLGSTDPNWSWNTDIAELSIAGPVPFTNKKLTFFNNFNIFMSDDYFGPVANQLHSSLFSNDSLWAPRQNNRFTHTFKLTYDFGRGTKLSISNQHSLAINQNSRTLQIVGFDAILSPGFQFNRSLNLDNASTYTHHSNLTALNFNKVINESWILNASAGRLFTNLRADANGRPFRTETVDQIYDEYSIVTDPVQVFNPDDDVIYVLPGPGFVNNGGISSLWHDHYASENTFKVKLKKYNKDKTNVWSFGVEQKFNEYQWVDVTRPWVGAPIQINDSISTPSISVGSSSDIWKVKPNNGGIFVQDYIQYKGIIATLGARLNYWAPGKFADQAVEDENSPVIDQVRKDYLDNTIKLFGLRYKARILPKLNVSFPITSNNVLYFNYGHSMRMAHPRFLYAGLDPEYQDRSFLSFLGNPDLDPEVNVSYEVGLKSSITKDFAFTLTAFNNNRFDYIVSRRVFTTDRTGRQVTKTMYINQDYAKIQGAELNLQYRFNKILRSFFNVGYQVARGKSNSARESSLQIVQNGEVPLSTEQYLAWDRPWELKGGLVFTPDTMVSFWPKVLKGFRGFLLATYRSGLRYTPMEEDGVNDLGRPLYRQQVENYLEERASPWINVDLVLSNTFRFSKSSGITLSIEARNLLNNKNAQIINPVTGTAYEDGDNVPNNWRDNRYLGPEESGLPPNNPARYLAPTQLLFGVKFRF